MHKTEYTIQKDNIQNSNDTHHIPGIACACSFIERFIYELMEGIMGNYSYLRNLLQYRLL